MNLKIFSFFVFLSLSLIFFSSVSAENSKVDDISKNLRCLICQGQSVYDSNSEFALSVKTLISEKIDLSDLSKGVYTLEISNSESTITEKIIVE